MQEVRGEIRLVRKHLGAHGVAASGDDVTLDKREAEREAQRAIQARDPQQALVALWGLLERSHVLEEELANYLRMMGECYRMLDRPRAAASIALFLGDVGQAAAVSSGRPLDLARCAQRAGDPGQAARYFESAGWAAHAAMSLEDAGDLRGARVLWERLAETPRLREQAYTLGLVRFNLARACAKLGDHGAARRATVAAMHHLEAAADGFETRGLRERAFDCYQVIMTIGREGSFENLAEGYLNCVRILREDNLKYYVLQYYEDFQDLALKRGELHAAATLFREAAEYARRLGLPYARHYQKRAAETHVLAAERAHEEGGSAELVENAYLAAVDAFNGLGLYSGVRGLYGRLSRLELGEKRRARYVRLAERLASMVDEPAALTPFPEYLRTDTAYPEIWRLDVAEWEQAGDPAETMIDVVLEPAKWPDFTRRRALLCRLAQLEAPEAGPSEATQARLAGLLGRVEIYSALAPLEAMYESDSAMVRAAAMRAVRQLFFKRSFVLIMAGLGDDDASVRREALAGVGALHFGHALDPLSRIYRESTDPEVRRTALASIGKIPTLQAAELLVDVLRQGERAEREAARDLLARADHAEVTPMLQRALASEAGATRAELERVLRARGGQ